MNTENNKTERKSSTRWALVFYDAIITIAVE